MNKPVEINGDCQFIKDLNNNEKFAMFNLITSKGAMKLWCKGIKPSRHWKVTQVKEYFGVNGNKEVLKDKLNLLYDILTRENKGSK